MYLRHSTWTWKNGALLAAAETPQCEIIGRQPDKHASFQYLADLPVSFLKIEGSLIQQVKDKRVRQIVKRISDIAKDLQLTTIAEFVEDADTADILCELEIDWAQGYFFGRPVLAKQ